MILAYLFTFIDYFVNCIVTGVRLSRPCNSPSLARSTQPSQQPEHISEQSPILSMGSDIDNNPLQDSQLIDSERTVTSQSTAQQVIDYSSQPMEQIVDSSSIQEPPSELAIDFSKPEVASNIPEPMNVSQSMAASIDNFYRTVGESSATEKPVPQSDTITVPFKKRGRDRRTSKRSTSVEEREAMSAVSQSTVDDTLKASPGDELSQAAEVLNVEQSNVETSNVETSKGEISENLEVVSTENLVPMESLDATPSEETKVDLPQAQSEEVKIDASLAPSETPSETLGSTETSSATVAETSGKSRKKSRSRRGSRKSVDEPISAVAKPVPDSSTTGSYSH